VKKVFDLKDKKVFGISAADATYIRAQYKPDYSEADSKLFEQLFKKIITASKQGATGLRLDSDAQLAVKANLDKFKELGYHMIETDLLWSGDKKIVHMKTLEPDESEIELAPEDYVKPPLKIAVGDIPQSKIDTVIYDQNMTISTLQQELESLKKSQEVLSNETKENKDKPADEVTQKAIQNLDKKVREIVDFINKEVALKKPSEEAKKKSGFLSDLNPFD
jgi:hypothetical protein